MRFNEGQLLPQTKTLHKRFLGLLERAKSEDMENLKILNI